MLVAIAWPALAGQPPQGCAWLCGNWILDVVASESPESRLDPALAKQKRAAGQREQLLEALAAPAAVTLAEQGRQILIQFPGEPVRRLLVDRTHTRVDSRGTAEIRSSWRSDDSLRIVENRGRRHVQAEVYALQPDGSLIVTREVERPGLKRVRVRSVYRRSETGLESTHNQASGVL
ncbi:MAG: hypothetical protein M3Y79_04330 [Pseudomonadota bacterium]|nr:hypothetical protein [Pseudomonadota bacterium]